MSNSIVRFKTNSDKSLGTDHEKEFEEKKKYGLNEQRQEITPKNFKCKDVYE